MIYFITVLRAIAICFVTNSHYLDIYPSNIMASGGLLGDVLFFAISGFCLVNIKNSFLHWYGKRLLRIFPPLWVATIFFMIIGFYSYGNSTISLKSFLYFLVYPTAFHFIAYILVLYIAYYVVLKTQFLRTHIPLVILAIGLVQLIIYLFFYDKSIYHIDNFEQPMIHFIFFISMLIGAYVKINIDKFLNKRCILAWVLLPIVAITYLFTKTAFSQIKSISYFQILNQVVLIVLLVLILRCFASINARCERMPLFINKAIVFLASIAFEIYMVQYYFIVNLKNIMAFPFNWLLITVSIVLGAFILHVVSEQLKKGITFLVHKGQKRL